MAQRPDYILDISSLGDPAAATDPAQQGGAKREARPWLAVRWTCCSTYSRIYRNRRGDAYEGHCPKCGKPVKARIGPGGTSSRFFEAG